MVTISCRTYIPTKKGHAAEACDVSHDHIWYKSHESHFKKKIIIIINAIFYNTTSMTLTAQILVLQPSRQLGSCNSNLYNGWDDHINFGL